MGAPCRCTILIHVMIWEYFDEALGLHHHVCLMVEDDGDPGGAHPFLKGLARK